MSNTSAPIGVSSGIHCDSIAEELVITAGKVEDTMRSLQNVLDRINRRAAEVSAHEKRIEEMEDKMKQSRDKASSTSR
jgi:hypothetical protein